MRNLLLPISVWFLLINTTYAQTIVSVRFYDMTRWNSSQYKSFKVTGGSANPFYDMTFRLLFPKNYDATYVSTVHYPLVLMLHGAGESALGNYKWGFYREGDPRRFNNDHHLLHLGPQFLTAVNKGVWPGFVLFPQSPDGFWNGTKLDDAIEILKAVMKRYKVDPNRIIIMGLSSGGQGTWEGISRYTNLFASALPFSGIGLPNYNNTTKVAHLPIWYFQGELDPSPSKYTADRTIQALRKVGGTPRYTVYKNTGHGTWNKAIAEPDFFPFLKRYTKLSIHAYYGKTDFYRGESIRVKLGISPGFSAYQWRKNGVLISGASRNEITATSVGAYTVRFRRGNSWTGWSAPLVIRYKLGSALTRVSTITSSSNQRVTIPQDSIPAQQDQLLVSPNPFDQQLEVKIYARQGEKLSFGIINSMGELVKFQEETVEQEGFNTVVLDVRNLPTNPYILKIQKGQAAFFRHILKQ